MNEITRHILKGPKFVDASKKVHQKKVGMVVGVYNPSTRILSIGWSLCNTNDRQVTLTSMGRTPAYVFIPGDRFDANQGLALARGRALTSLPTNMVFSTTGKPPTTEHLMDCGIPQSALRAIGEVVATGLGSFQVSTISIYSEKSPKVRKPNYLWTEQNATPSK